jgi:phospholipid/cholesterol/gamma-HCH transport system substrate-binding protein
MKISNEVKVGVLAVVSIAMLYLGFNYLKGADFFSNTNKYPIIFDNVGSLQSSNPVKINGVQIGRVKSTEILQDRNNKVLVVVEMDKKIMLRSGTKAVLTSELLGGSAIQLLVPYGGKQLVSGDTLQATTETGIQALLQEKALPVLRNADSLIKSLTHVVNQFDKTGYVLNKLLASADQTAIGLNATLDQNKQNIAATMANLNALSASLIETEKGIRPILGNLQTTTDSLKALRLGQTLSQANAAVVSLQKTMSALEQGQGTAGKLLKDDKLYQNINAMVVSVNKLMTNFRQYPKRYVSVSVFGKKDKGPADSPADTTEKY